MGCDIHAIIEVQKTICSDYNFGIWKNAGDPGIYRDYELFAVLGDVRNDNNLPFISKDRVKTDNGIDYLATDTESSILNSIPCAEFQYMARQLDADGHSHSYVTLREMQAFTKFPDNQDRWLKLIERVSKIAAAHEVINPDKIRLVFCFDS